MSINIAWLDDYWLPLRKHSRNNHPLTAFLLIEGRFAKRV
jgi:hypothetical protein